ncbi:choice-of-anchor V domain-containing protein [Chitinophagaceae bacterium MMS25-I14]
MRKKILLFTAFGAMTVFTLSSYKNGPAAGGAGNRTGSAGSTANCSTGGCHAANTTHTTVGLTLTNSSNQVVSSYVGGQTYTVTVVGANTSASLPKFGFQVSCVGAANTSSQRGTFTGGGNVSIRTSGSLSLAEHNTSIAGTGGGTAWAYTTTFTWTAPAVGSGPVEFFIALNAVNGDNSTSGDQPNVATVTFNEATTGIGTLSGDVAVKAYPNPATDHVQISLDNATAGTYALNVFDMTGRKVANSAVTVNGTQTEVSLSTADWAAGMYHVQISKDGMQRTIAVVKK